MSLVFIVSLCSACRCICIMWLYKGGSSHAISIFSKGPKLAIFADPFINTIYKQPSFKHAVATKLPYSLCEKTCLKPRMKCMILFTKMIFIRYSSRHRAANLRFCQNWPWLLLFVRTRQPPSSQPLCQGSGTQKLIGGCPRGVMVKSMDCGIVVR